MDSRSLRFSRGNDGPHNRSAVERGYPGYSREHIAVLQTNPEPFNVDEPESCRPKSLSRSTHRCRNSPSPSELKNRRLPHSKSASSRFRFGARGGRQRQFDLLLWDFEFFWGWKVKLWGYALGGREQSRLTEGLAHSFCIVVQSFGQKRKQRRPEAQRQQGYAETTVHIRN